MKILVIFTGGTIGSSIKEGWADVDRSTQYVLLKRFRNIPDTVFVTSSPYSVLSENLSAVELNLLQKEIDKNLTKDFDGIIVTHGTDTLQYSAAAAEYAFSGCGVPVVFVSADYPLEDPKTNGYANFEAALAFIRSKAANGVFVSYKNDNTEQTNIHIASRLLRHGEFDANLYSVGGKPFAVYKDGCIYCDGTLSQANPTGITEYVQNPGILSVGSCPGNDYSYSLDGVNAVILEPYHSGTLDTANRCLKEFCLRAKEKNIPVFVTNTGADVFYKSTERYAELEIHAIPFGTNIAAYMKIWAAISMNRNVSEFVNTQIANEYVSE